jgi:hypothetical protein
MNTRTLTAGLGVWLLAPAMAAAQTPDSLIAASYQGQSRFRVNIDGGSRWGGDYDGDISGEGAPAEGAGTRMMWYPRRAALRAGQINGTQWDAANIGEWSVAMGQNARASGSNSIAFGWNATAAGSSTFAAGEDVTASGAASVALGYHAHTNARQGSFVFADRASVDSVRAGNAHQATFRTSCGFRIFTSSNLSTGVAFGGQAVSGLGVCPTDYFGQSNTMIATSTGAYLSTGGTWTNSSDVARKHRFLEVDGAEVLDRLRRMPISTWSYRVDGVGVRHIGPTAQDFRAAFGLGSDEVSIATVDADGVALAGVQALDARDRAQQAEIDALRAENARLRDRLLRVEELLDTLAAKP